MTINWKENADKIMAISATITAVVALVVAVLEVRGEQEFQKLSVEPYIELGNTGGGVIDYCAFLIINNGLGPAIIQTDQLLIDNISMGSWIDAISAVTESNEPRTYNYSDIYPGRRVMPGETLEVFKITPYTDFAQQFHREMTNRAAYSLCYCSIYGDCWNSSYGFQHFHQPVPQCPVL